MTDDAPAPEPAPKKPKGKRSVWRSPGGLSAIAAMAAVVVAVVSLLVQQREPGPTVSTGVPAASTPSVSEEPGLFVYGSSMPGMSRHDLISKYVLRSARDSVEGQLYDSGLGYPMARFGGDGQIRGVLLWLDPATAQDALTEMTRVEAGLFHPVLVRTASGVTAQAYEWIGSTDGFPRIDAWDGSTAGYGHRVPWWQLQVGDCFQAQDDITVLTSWCQAPHALEAYHAGVVEDSTPDPRAAAETACTRTFARFVGRPQSASDLLTQVFAEPASSSERPRFLCAVGVSDASHAGTLKGSDR